jgi:hypothetical protein
MAGLRPIIGTICCVFSVGYGRQNRETNLALPDFGEGRPKTGQEALTKAPLEGGIEVLLQSGEFSWDMNAARDSSEQSEGFSIGAVPAKKMNINSRQTAGHLTRVLLLCSI